MISVGFDAKNRGNGIPISGTNLEMLNDECKLTKFLDNYLRSNEIEGYKRLDEGQVSLFELL